MSLSVASAHSASAATTIPMITVFEVATTDSLKRRIHGDAIAARPSTTLAHSSQALTRKSVAIALAATRTPRPTALHRAYVSLWYLRIQGEAINHSPRIRFTGSCQCLTVGLAIVCPPREMGHRMIEGRRRGRFGGCAAERFGRSGLRLGSSGALAALTPACPRKFQSQVCVPHARVRGSGAGGTQTNSRLAPRAAMRRFATPPGTAALLGPTSLSGGTRISTMVATRFLIQPLTLPGSSAVGLIGPSAGA